MIEILDKFKKKKVTVLTILYVVPSIPTKQANLLYSLAVTIITRRFVMLSSSFFTLDCHNYDVKSQGRIYTQFTHEETEAPDSKLIDLKS